MPAIHRPIIVVAMLCVTLGAGCFAPKQEGIEAAKRSIWNPFARPESGYLDPKITTEEEPVPADPKDPISLRLKYANWMETSGNHAEALEQYRAVLREKPKNIDAQIGLARVQLSTGQIDSAEALFKTLLVTAPNRSDVFLGYSKCLMQQQQWQAASDSLQQGLALAPNDKDLHYQLGIALVHAGDLTTAQEHFQLCVGAAAGHYNTGLILKDQGNLAEAEAQLNLALQVDPNLKEAENWLAELRRQRSGREKTLSKSASPIEPQIQRVSYQEFDVNSTTTIQTGQNIIDSASGKIETASGHSVAQETMEP